MSCEEKKEALIAALIEIERFVGHGGWDQPARLFSLVPSDVVIAADKQLAEKLGIRGSADGLPEGALTSIEQQKFHSGTDLGEALATIGWPDSVSGCAIVIERSFLPRGAEEDLPADEAELLEYVSNHPQREDIRIIAGALKSDTGIPEVHCLARLSKHEQLISDPNIAPDLTEALAQTLIFSLQPPSDFDAE